MNLSKRISYDLPKEVKNDKTTLSVLEESILKSEEELGILEGIVRYATKEMQFDPKYQELRRVGFGKTVVIRKEDGSTESFRVSQANLVYPNRASGYATPLSPVGRLCTIVNEGDVRYSKAWGEYEIIEVRNFIRYEYEKAEDNINNFKIMGCGDIKKILRVNNLKSAIKTLKEYLEIRSTTSEESNSEIEDITPFTDSQDFLIEEEDDYSFDTFIVEDDEAEFFDEDEDQYDYYGHSATFYLNRTKQQDDVMSRSPQGPLIVEGIAGSGKTCAALGRAKVLCDFTSDNAKDSEKTSYYLGESEDDNEWMSYDSTFFSQDSSVGFVRTGELIQYLKASCLELNLPNLPVREYKELQDRLMRQRNIEQSEKVKARETKSKYQLSPELFYSPDTETSMLWVAHADKIIANNLDIYYQEIETIFNKIEESIRDSNPIFLECLESIKKESIIEIGNTREKLKSKSAIRKPFYLHGIVKEINNCFKNIESKLFTKDTYWLSLSGETIQSPSIESLAKLIILNSPELYYKHLHVDTIENTATAEYMRVIFSEQHLISLIAKGTKYYNHKRQPFNLKDKSDLFDAYAESDRIALYSTNSENPDSYTRIYKTDLHELCRLLTGGGASGRKMLFKKNSTGVLSLSQAIQGLPLLNLSKDKNPKGKSLASLIKPRLKKFLLEPIKFADLYAKALLKSKPSDWPNQEAFIYARNRLKQSMLADHDIDILLSIAHIMTVDSGESHGILSEPNYYKSVFIDEVQDFTEQQVFLMTYHADPFHKAVTMVGDMQQQLNIGSVKNLQNCFPYDGKVPQVLLTENKRQEHTPELSALSLAFRSLIQKDNRLTLSSNDNDLLSKALTDSDACLITSYANDESMLDSIFDAINQQPKGRTVAVIAPTIKHAQHYELALRTKLLATFRHSYVPDRVDLSKKYLVHFSSPKHMKGLEFDTVIMAGVEHFNWQNPTDLNSVYVSLTRPRKQLYVMGNFSSTPKHIQSFFRQH